MQIDIRVRHLDVPGELRRYVRRRLEFALGRFAPQLETVRVRLEDCNGPRGGEDKRCRIRVRGPRFGAVTIDETRTNVRAAVDVAADRLARTLARTLERTRLRPDPVATHAWSAPPSG